MADFVSKGEDFRRQAEKKLKGLGWFGNKYEEACELFEKAANNFKLGKCWKEAAEMYNQLAECSLKCDSKHEAATAYVEGSKCAAKANPAMSKEMLHKAVSLYTDMGRLNMAARQLKEIAEQNEKAGDKQEAIGFYEQAADLFETENSPSEATKCKLKIAEFSAELQDYQKAVGLFEEAAKRAVENNLLRFSARGYLQRAGLCLLCYVSADDFEIKLQKYKDIDLQFDGSRECMLLEACLNAFREVDVEAFSTALVEHDRVIRLDAWQTKVLLEVKKRIQNMELGVGGAGGGGDDDDELQ